MGEQGLAERLAAETARNLTILEGFGERIVGRLQDDAAMAASGTKVGPLPRDYMRMYREYRTGLRELRIEALLRQKLKLLDGDDLPMTDEEYQEALAELRQEGLLRAEREELERELAVRPQVRLPPASAVALDAVALDAVSEDRPSRAGLATEPPAPPPPPVVPEPDPGDADGDEDGGWM